ncbi:hypothetical protein QFZ30_003332 [Arthrobacter pascens]|uniref:DUF3027 domain-containing protein n=1 Tax=Arthrobacter pascens TaxID=1677 RepID=UPI00278CB770|nr:DUF3027 domain-containing protein [Arthrobacter pascens]MDQ0679950.1 hypothetical protein [Arthrobacter pascens]
MNPEAEQQEPAAGDQAGATARQDADPTATKTEAKSESKRRAGLPIWRTGKPDAFLAAAVDVARNAIEGITAASDIGRHLAAKSEGDRLVTHLFESKLPGYLGWQWYAVLTRNSRSKAVTVNELGLLPSEDSILAPEWVPWAERVRPEDAQETAAEGQHAAAPDARSGTADSVEPDVIEPDVMEPEASESELPESELREHAPEEQAHGRAAVDNGTAGQAD